MKNNIAAVRSHPFHISRLPKAVCLFVTLCITSFGNSPAQVTITYAQMKDLFGHPGGRLEVHGDSGASVLNIGGTGGSQVYDFTGLLYSSADLVTLWSVADIPRLRGHFPDSSVTFGESPESIRDNPVFLFVPDTMFEIGSAWISGSVDSQWYLHYLPPIPDFGGFPLVYGAAWSYTTINAETTYVNGVPTQIHGGTWGATLSADGFGTLHIPGFDLQCLRIRFVENGTGTRRKNFWFITREGAMFTVETTTAYPDTGHVYANRYLYLLGSGLVSVKEESARPTGFILHQNYPNPFNPSTTISYDLPKSEHVLLRIYDLLGRQVKTLVDGRENAGIHDIKWNANGMSSGVYFCRLQAGQYIETRKIMFSR